MKVKVKFGWTEEIVEVLFVVNNTEDNNHSILGVFDSPEKAAHAAEEQKKKIVAAGSKIPHMSMKCVVLNGGAYAGFRTWVGDEHSTTADNLAKNDNIKLSFESMLELEETFNKQL